MYFMLSAWRHQQAKVEELQKQLSEYIFVSETLDEMYVKEVKSSDELQKRVDAAKHYLGNIFTGDSIEDECHLKDLLDILDGKIVAELEQALKGDQYDEHRKKAEEVISKGASLTNHRIEL
ncbi:hypothetical protein NQ658_07000 [Acinetobacter baumannii]|nr:hypothetical protein [Acinetobacter baumannii]